MFSEDLRWHHLEPMQWARFTDSLRTGLSGGGPTLLVVRDGLRAARAVMDGRMVDLSDGPEGPVHIRDARDLGRLARQRGASQALCVSRGMLDKTLAELGRKVNHREPYGLQLATLYRTIRREHGRGFLTWPRRSFPPLPYLAARLAGRLYLPGTRSLLLLVFAPDGEVWTSLVIGASDGCIREIATAELLGEPPEGLRQLDWPRRLDWYRRQAADLVGAPAFGLFCGRAFWKRLCRGPRRARMLRQGMARGEAILDPFGLRYKLLGLAALLAEEVAHWNWVRRGAPHLRSHRKGTGSFSDR